MGLFRKNKPGTRARDKPVKNAAPAQPSARAVTLTRRTRGDASMTGSEAIYAAVSRIANTIACMPIHLYKGWELQENDPLEKLISYAPNPCMTGYSFRQAMQACCGNEGCAYALIVPERDTVTVKRLDVLDPAYVSTWREKDTREIWYKISDPDTGMEMWADSGSVIAIRMMSSNGERAIRPIDVLRGTLAYDASIKEFSVKQLEGVQSGVMLTVPQNGMLGATERKNLVEQFLDTYDDSGGRVCILEGGMTATTFNQSPVDAKVLDVERITRNRVATVYNIPPHMLGDYTDTSYSTAEQQMHEYLQLTILPIVTQWEAELNRKLLSWARVSEGYAFRFDMQALLRADAATMADANQKAIRGGWKTPNEVRKAEGLPPDPDGDVLMAARDMAPLKTILTGEEGEKK